MIELMYKYVTNYAAHAANDNLALEAILHIILTVFFGPLIWPLRNFCSNIITLEIFPNNRMSSMFGCLTFTNFDFKVFLQLGVE